MGAQIEGSSRRTGRVKWFNEARGFGFIMQGRGRADVFIHYRDIRGVGYRSLREGEYVEFGIGPGKNGHALRALDVCRLDSHKPQ